ncbi:hypothetical protein EHQ12_06880 [Leptospira gomenensis]|uniref:Uncharacterized protein n=1 Tax=Leptospira gomenensis TaxID=2484974 RepID=A0A5F1YFF4_9LEPT|nr:hypothetical protein [Leptospira gomenensis]TGK37443.1 hypothetical protein EHQ17_02505 [Leptospira gomenensis]TGK40802.1 hypothetical protein EHQ12_06880 [Leptospira gomenensis]TGK43028.1 hypothetical protein EHQ07_12800 [Leptospira gomenensis]TGK54272.1 hypothetical protein EHQ13_19555 [Leptospira gomenensis]
MEKFRLGVYVFGIIVVGILVFTLSKSWFILDRGVELVEPGSSKEEPIVLSDRSNDLLNHSVILWDRFLFYPFELSRETVAGSRKTLNHARNVTVIDLETGKPRKLFLRNVYIWDYFTGIKNEHEIGETSEESETDAVLYAGIDTGKNLILVGMTEDTNKDGFLNQRDRKQVFVYNPFNASLTGVLPRKYSLEKILPSAGKEKLVMIVSLEEEKEESKKKKPSPPSSLPETTFYIYDIKKARGMLVEKP